MNFIKEKGLFIALVVIMFTITMIGANRHVHFDQQEEQIIIASK